MPPGRTSAVVKRSVSIRGHRTSISLEAPFWEALRTLATIRGRSVAALVAEIDEARDPATETLSGTLRVAILEACRNGELPRDGAVET